MSAQSASGPHLAGEEGGPNYEQLPRGQLPPGVPFGDAQVNGVPPRTSQTTSVDEVSAATAVGTADGGIPMTQAAGSQLDPPLLPHATGREVSDAAGPASRPATAEMGMREVQGGVSPAPGQASTGPQMNRGGALLFPPSPLPGASPVNDRPFEAAEQQAQALRQQLVQVEMQAQDGTGATFDGSYEFWSGSDQVLSAMAKGIESLLMNQGARADRPETVKPGITELPTLPAYTPETGSIDLINWITHITPIMEDLSDSSSVWWSDTLKEVMLWYSKYSVATPLERIQLLPVVTSAPSKAEWARVERRATAMMLTAIPATLKEEVIAAGGVNTLNLLAKLFSTYQPGNRQEKALVLANLERPGECQDAATAVEALRKWALWRRRATAIGITEPDSSVLLQGLDRICSAVVRADPELAFRVSLIRSTLQVDVNPTVASVTKFFQHLQAELEQQARLGAAKGPEMNPRLKALGPYSEGAQQPATMTPPPPPGAKASGNQCKFFLSEKGCRQGKDCRYPHQWSAFDKAEKSRRCLVCGAVGHKSKECRAAGGMVITWEGAVVGWRSGRQPFISLSTAEGELVAGIETLTLAMSMKAIIDQFGVDIPITTLYIDNQATLALASHTTSASWRTRHLRLRAAFLQERVDAGNLQLKFVPGRLQLADLLTKGFPRQRLEELCGLWGLVDVSVAIAQKMLVKMMVVLTMMVQSARGAIIEKEPPGDPSANEKGEKNEEDAGEEGGPNYEQLPRGQLPPGVPFGDAQVNGVPPRTSQTTSVDEVSAATAVGTADGGIPMTQAAGSQLDPPLLPHATGREVSDAAGPASRPATAEMGMREVQGGVSPAPGQASTGPQMNRGGALLFPPSPLPGASPVNDRPFEAAEQQAQALRQQLVQVEMQAQDGTGATFDGSYEFWSGSDQVLSAMAKGIESLLMNQGARADRPETVKPGITELPTLPAYTPETGSIDLINWITHITPIMEDLSDSSSVWWSDTLKEVMLWYSKYSVATPLERIQLLPVVTSAPSKAEWARVERRATAMMLTAIPATLKEEVIAAGGVNTLNLLAKLFSTYQPGNRQEKALVLANLERPGECQDAATAVEALRKWALWRRRATAIGITEPDSSVLLQGLDRICSAVVRADPELAFRVSLIRSTLQVDVNPTVASVTKFFQHLQAELEQQARLGAAKGPEMNPRLKALGPYSEGAQQPATMTPPPPPGAKASGNQCKFFLSEKGCRQGKDCRYPHQWSAFDKAEKSRRCLVCGAVGHKSKECRAAGGGLASRPKDAAKAPPPKEASASPSSAPSSTSSSPARKVGFDGVSDAVVKALSVLKEVKKIDGLASLASTVDKWVKKWGGTDDSRPALLDSGATHPLRRPRDHLEWENAMNVSVALAGDTTTTMKQTLSGTLLSGDELTQVIVPLGRVISNLGYRLRWTATECCLERNGDDTIPLQVVRGCPEVDEQTAQRLIDELEQCQVPRLKEATLDSVRILRDVEVSWWSCLVEYVDTGNVQAGSDSLLRASFFDEADREDLRKLLLRYPNDGGWQSMKDLGLNRRTRKRLMNASTWIVRWDPPGFARKSDLLQKVGRMSEVAYLNVNSMMARGDILTTWKVLLWAASTGRIGALLTRDSAPTPAEYAAHGVHRARVHLLHALASAGQYRRGCAVPRFLVESRRGTMSETLHWMNDGKAQRYCDEMDICSPMYVEDEAVELVSGLTGVVYDKGFGRVRMARMSQDAAWRLHVMRNHQPFRRDCALCVRNAATGRQHRATLHPSGYTLSVDVAGPLKGYGRSPDGKFFRYFVIGAFRIPLLDGGVGRDGYVHGHPIPDGPIAEDEEVLSEEEEDPEAPQEEAEGPSAKDIEEEREEWRKLKASFREPLMSETLYFCVPVNSKKAVHVLPALQQMVIDVRALGYPVVRVHSDRGGELRGNAVKRWVLNQGILRTTSTGSEPAENGAAEAGVRFLKRRARILLDAAGLTREHWPTAVQTAALQQRCEKLGIPSPAPVAYGAKVYVKTKKYKTGDVESMKPHWMQGKYLGPSTDVRGGHVILKSTGTFLTTTHVRVAREPPRLDDVAPPILVDFEDPPPLPAPTDPPDAAPEHPGDKPRVELPSSSGRGRERSSGPIDSSAAEHPGDKHRVELPSSSGRGPFRSEASDALPPYPTGPPITYSPPGTRVRGKSPGVRMKALRAGDYEDMYEQMVDPGDDADPSYSQEEIMMRVLKAQEKQAVEAVARELLAAGDFSKEACQRLLRSLGGFHTRWRTPRTTAGQGMVLGAYVRGGSFGITKHGREMPYTMRFLNKFLLIRLQYTMPGSTSTWTTLAMQRANEIPAHRDVHNQRGTRNYVMEIADESLEGLWVEGTEGTPQVDGGDGQSYPHEYQTPDGHVHQGRIHSIDEPVAFDPRARHAMVHEPGMKWVLSAYTPSGVQSLLQADVDYLFVNGFPVTGTGVSLPTVRAIQRVSYGHGAPWETTPEEVDPSLLPQFVPWSGAQGAGAQEEVEPSDHGDDVDEAEGDWELFVEDSEESCVMEQGSEPEDEPLPRLRALCSTMDPGPERELLYRCYEGHLERKDCEPTVQEEMAVNMEEWETVLPKMAKVEPEFTEDIETLISGLSEPLRHTHNVNPRDVRATMERWRKAIEKELKVIEKGFNRVDVDELRKLKKSHQVQELPAKLVYTLKPPAEDAVPGTEEAKCKRKARIVCCGNFNDQDPGEVFASGAAAESLRCALTLAALRKWAAGGLDIGGAFMLTPLPQDKVLFSITPPAILIQLGLATATERWILTRAMYGLRWAKVGSNNQEEYC
ncbi:Retrovirus-related Pol polyprotein from transposon TNT 1-94 [Symbiodinium microadriaticum]|uniref:Retrovirus-related Pol polyprotein from transposon TNT 1-94 n=1 Tax=Symbiodinium microadriaticum TaxID=2951 RepID=A0A1Q9DYA6_SYMMI|nr:Retrovirus-related Pol polyprotein from transposon TNT 1-94 [Symbiodinium microadriaticum]